MEGDYYSVLQLTAKATREEIHRAYRLLALQYHPDRNSSPQAAATMAKINEAYAVLSEPARRRKYDQRERFSCADDLSVPIMAAARETLLRQRWKVLGDEGSLLTLENGSRRIWVALTDRLTNEMLRKLGRRNPGIGVVLAVEVEKPINLSLQVTVIELLRSSYTGPGFPDEVYGSLFAAFLGSTAPGVPR